MHTLPHKLGSSVADGVPIQRLSDVIDRVNRSEAKLSAPAPAPVTAAIKGYRQLSEHEQDLINKVKAAEDELASLLELTRAHHAHQRALSALTGEAAAAESNRLSNAEPERWRALARTHFQEGFMALVRSIAQPRSAL